MLKKIATILGIAGLVSLLGMTQIACELPCEKEGTSWCGGSEFIYDCVDEVAESTDCLDECSLQGYSAASCVEVTDEFAYCECF